MKWLTWQNVGIDRMGCVWLIKKYLDPQAEFEFIPAGQKIFTEGAEPFDIPGVRLSHRRGHCTFHTILKEYELKDPVLYRIAQMIDEADTVQEVNLEPAAAGLDLICRGIRRLSPDDLTALERSQLIYDALYAELTQEPL
jgi:hypothetical protein